MYNSTYRQNVHTTIRINSKHYNSTNKQVGTTVQKPTSLYNSANKQQAYTTARINN